MDSGQKPEGAKVASSALLSGLCEADWNSNQLELYETMSDISEECYCAGWLSGLEYAIWGGLCGDDRAYDTSEMDAEKLERCRQLCEQLSGWMVWIDDNTKPGLPVSDWGPRFVTMQMWTLHLAANAAVQPTCREAARSAATAGYVAAPPKKE